MNLAPATMALLLAGCAGATESPLFDAPIASSSGGHDAGAGGNLDAGSPPAPVDAGHADTSAPMPVDASPPPPVVDAAPDVVVPVDATPPPPPDSIPCGQAACDPATTVCCVTTNGNGGGNGNRTFTCESASTCTQDNGLALPCAKAADCEAQGSPAGTVCCVTFDALTGVANDVACLPAAECADPNTQTYLCDPSGTNVCPAAEICRASTITIPPYSICATGP